MPRNWLHGSGRWMGAAALAVAVSACSSSGNSVDAYRKRALRPTADLIAATQHLSDAARSGNTATVQSECTTALNTLAHDKPALETAPDATLQSLVKTAIASFDKGLRECTAGSFTAFAADIQQGEKALDDATHRLATLTGQSS